jgi:hypothetical protein
MSNELAKKRNDAYVARYRTEEDPFTKFGNEGATGIVGTLYTNVKGDWLAGRDKAIVPAGTKMLVVVPTALRGWVKFGDHGIVSAEVGLVADNYLVKHRSALGDLDESLWPVGRDGKVRDMCTQYVSVQMIEMTPRTVTRRSRQRAGAASWACRTSAASTVGTGTCIRAPSRSSSSSRSRDRRSCTALSPVRGSTSSDGRRWRMSAPVLRSPCRLIRRL